MVINPTAEVLCRTGSLTPLSVPSIAKVMGVAPGEPIPVSMKLATPPLHEVVIDVHVIELCVI